MHENNHLIWFTMLEKLGRPQIYKSKEMFKKQYFENIMQNYNSLRWKHSQHLLCTFHVLGSILSTLIDLTHLFWIIQRKNSLFNKYYPLRAPGMCFVFLISMFITFYCNHLFTSQFPVIDYQSFMRPKKLFLAHS